MFVILYIITITIFKKLNKQYIYKIVELFNYY